MPMQRTKYAAEFKSDVVKQVDKGHAVVDVAKRVGAPEGALYGWVNKFKSQMHHSQAAPMSSSGNVKRAMKSV
jgi:transposase-like protein